MVKDMIRKDVLCKAIAFHSTTKQNMKNKISPDSIIGCVDIIKSKNVLKYKINRDCKY